jgi:hypothetical protein
MIWNKRKTTIRFVLNKLIRYPVNALLEFQQKDEIWWILLVRFLFFFVPVYWMMIFKRIRLDEKYKYRRYSKNKQVRDFIFFFFFAFLLPEGRILTARPYRPCIKALIKGCLFFQIFILFLRKPPFWISSINIVLD